MVNILKQNIEILIKSPTNEVWVVEEKCNELEAIEEEEKYLSSVTMVNL